MNKEQENLIASGLWLLIKDSDKIKDSEKKVWMYDFDELFGDKESKKENCCEMPKKEKYPKMRKYILGKDFAVQKKNGENK